MKYLSTPTSRLPDGRLTVDRTFTSDICEAVNQLNDEVKAMKADIEALRKVDSSESESRKVADAGLSSRIDALGAALGKVSEAVEVLIGGTDL